VGEVLEKESMTVGRLAPSPTGALHLGNIRTFMVAWLSARSKSGKVILRMEDLDHPRDKPGADVEIIETLKWLGFDWDEFFVQSARRDLYRSKLNRLRDKVYPCVCSRRDVESAQSAPHEGEQLYYQGVCRGRFSSWEEAVNFNLSRGKTALPCWRFSTPKGRKVVFDDLFEGTFEQDVSKVLGDFPLARDRDGAGYTFACLVDDVEMGVTEVVRGRDLLSATPAQVILANELYPGKALLYCHIPLVVGPDGKRLAKRHGDTRISSFRQSGVDAKTIISFLGETLGLCDKGEVLALEDFVSRFSLDCIPKENCILTKFPIVS
jgi:glutamyl-tRNA synthetase